MKEETKQREKEQKELQKSIEDTMTRTFGRYQRCASLQSGNFTPTCWTTLCNVGQFGVGGGYGQYIH